MDATTAFGVRVSAETRRWPDYCRHFVVTLPPDDPHRGSFKRWLDQYRLDVEGTLRQWEARLSPAHQHEALQWLQGCSYVLKHLSEHPTPQQKQDPVLWAMHSLIPREWFARLPYLTVNGVPGIPMPSAANAPGLPTTRPSSHSLHANPYRSAQHYTQYLPNEPPGSVLPLPGPPQPGSHAHAEMAGTAAPVVARLDQLAAAWHGTPLDLLQYTTAVSSLLTTTTWRALSEKAQNLLLELLNSTVELAQSGCYQLSGLAQPFHYLAILGLDFDDRGAHYTAPPGVPFTWDALGEPNFIYDPLAPSAVPGIPSLPPPTMSGSQNLPPYLPSHSTAGQAGPPQHAVHHHVHPQHAPHHQHPHTHPDYPPSSAGPHSLAHWHRRLNLRQAQRYRTTPERFRDAGLLE